MTTTGNDRSGSMVPVFDGLKPVGPGGTIHSGSAPFRTVRFMIARTLLFLSVALPASGPLVAQTPQQAEAAQRAVQQDLAEAQADIDALDDETRELLLAYRSELARLDRLNDYNANLQVMLDSQAEEARQLERDLLALEDLRRNLVPLMLDMQEALADFVQLDKPFLVDERAARVAALADLQGRADVNLAEKYRRLIEAYIIETEYGQSLEAWEGRLELDGTPRTVEFLRLGRTAIYYLTLDHQRAGYWDADGGRWSALDGRHVDSIVKAVRVARRQAPPDLLDLPLPPPEVPDAD